MSEQTTEACEQRTLERRRLRAVTRKRFGQTLHHALRRGLQSLEQQVRPRVFHVMRETARNKDNGVVGLAQLAISLDAEPLSPGDLDKVLRKTGARYLLSAFDGYARCSIFARLLARYNEIVGKPSRVAGLPIETDDMPKIYSKSIRAGQEVEKEAGSNRIRNGNRLHQSLELAPSVSRARGLSPGRCVCTIVPT